MKLPFKKALIITIMTISFAVAGIEAYKQLGNEIEAAEYDSGLRVDELIVETQNGERHTFQVEVAEKPMDIQIGLMHRKSMPKDHGMLFLLHKEPKQTSFWMKNTLIPLDMLFVGKDGKILNIHHRAQPLSLAGIKSGVPVTAVIELNGGRAEKLGIRIGDRVIHPSFY